MIKKSKLSLYEDLDINLSTALNMFMKQTVIKNRYPCSLETSVTKDTRSSYPEGFFELFGSGNNLGFDEEPNDLPISKEFSKITELNTKDWTL